MSQPPNPNLSPAPAGPGPGVILAGTPGSGLGPGPFLIYGMNLAASSAPTANPARPRWVPPRRRCRPAGR